MMRSASSIFARAARTFWQVSFRGNQQKLLLAKMMMLDPSIVIIDEPTRGIDVGTKEQIYQFIANLADEGNRSSWFRRKCRN